VPITEGVTIPPRSRTFTEQEVLEAHAALKDGKNIGYGTFDTQASARSAGHTLNRMIQETEPGATKYATTVFPSKDDPTKFTGAMLPKPAKVVNKKSAKKGGARKSSR
jgi:hypothetical protein